MSVTMEKTVRELALEKPGAARVFESLGIDYCCGGKQTLEQACRAASVPVDKVIDALEAAQHSGQCRGQPDTNWQAVPLADVIYPHQEHAPSSTPVRRLPVSARSSTRFARSTERTIPSFCSFAKPSRAWLRN